VCLSDVACVLGKRDPPVGTALAGCDREFRPCPFEGALGDSVRLARFLLDVPGPARTAGERSPEVVLSAGLGVPLLVVALGAEEVPDAAVGLAVEDEPADIGGA